jgi:hypothetical protein
MSAIESRGYANGVAGVPSDAAVHDSKTSGPQFCLPFIASKGMRATGIS